MVKYVAIAISFIAITISVMSLNTSRAVSSGHPAVIINSDGTSHIHMGGGIRAKGKRIFLIRNDRHEPININRVRWRNQGDFITVNYDAIRKVGTFVVVPDNELARAGFSFGASVGRRGAVISCVRYHRPVPCRQISQFPGGNIIFYGLHLR